MSKAGIDYGLGKTNIDKERGIRFGVINQNALSHWAVDDICASGIDMDFEDFKSELEASLENAIENVFQETGISTRQNNPGKMAEEIVDNLEWDGYEGTGDCTRYYYEEDGYRLNTCSDGDIFVLKSKYVTRAPYCSPCAPGACYLASGENDESLPLAYCLGPDWFDSDDHEPCPYPVWELDGMKLIYEPKKEECERCGGSGVCETELHEGLVNCPECKREECDE